MRRRTGHTFGAWRSPTRRSFPVRRAPPAISCVGGGLAGDPGVVLPMQFRFRGEVLEMFSTIAVFGAPLDVTLDDIAIEAFYPSDERTASLLRSFAAS